LIELNDLAIFAHAQARERPAARYHVRLASELSGPVRDNDLLHAGRRTQDLKGAAYDDEKWRYVANLS